MRTAGVALALVVVLQTGLSVWHGHGVEPRHDFVFDMCLLKDSFPQSEDKAAGHWFEKSLRAMNIELLGLGGCAPGDVPPGKTGDASYAGSVAAATARGAVVLVGPLFWHSKSTPRFALAYGDLVATIGAKSHLASIAQYELEQGEGGSPAAAALRQYMLRTIVVSSPAQRAALLREVKNKTRGGPELFLIKSDTFGAIGSRIARAATLPTRPSGDRAGRPTEIWPI